MIEDIIAQSHLLVDALTYQEGAIALSALRTLQDHQGPGGAFSTLLGITFDEVQDGRCTASLEVRQHHLNPHGIAHGGVTYSLADSACGGAALSSLGQPFIVTQDIQIRYHGPARPGKIIAQCEVVHHGKRTITALFRITQFGTLIASGSATFAILSGEEASIIRGDIE